MQYDVIIIGGSYAGLSAAMALGRAIRSVLIIDEGKPCNIQTPYSHNFITQDGKAPLAIKGEALEQVLKYKTVKLKEGRAVAVEKLENNIFKVTNSDETIVEAKKILFATGVKDIMPAIKGFGECWGISILHCPYCHGYEVRNLDTGIFADGDMAFDFAKLISNWTDKLTVYTNGATILSGEQQEMLQSKAIQIHQKSIAEVAHTNGILKELIFEDGSRKDIATLYARPEMKQHCEIPMQLGCILNEMGLLAVDMMQKTNIDGVYAAGDCTVKFRSVAMAVSTGTMAGAAINHELINENF